MKTILPALALAALVGAAPAHAQEAPAAYCARVRLDDATRPLPPALAPAARRLFPGFDDAKALADSTVWRCMGGAVQLCNHGANLTCAKAERRRVSPGATAFCRDNPGAQVVPMAATGHDTIWSWACAGRRAHIEGGAARLDPRGFFADQWFRAD